MTGLSLKWRISLWISAVLVAVIVTISIVAYVEFKESHLRETDRILLTMANGIVVSMDDRESKEEIEEEIRVISGRIEPGLSTLYRIWIDGSSTDIYASDVPQSKYGQWLRDIPEPKRQTKEKYSFMNFEHEGNEFRAIWMCHEINNRNVNILLARYSRFTFHELDEFLKLLVILGGSLVIASIAAVSWTVRCNLLPVHTAAERLNKISEPYAGKNIFNNLKVPEELHPFVEALRDMFERLDMVLSRQRQFSSDAAHELRTPLAGIKSTLQASQMRPRPISEYQQAIDEALKDIRRMEHLIDQLLILARLDGAKKDADDVEVPLDVLLGELAINYNNKVRKSGSRIILTESSAVTVLGNLEELSRLFSNVLENAVKYGPPGGTISISLMPESDSNVKVCVKDEGGGIPSEAIPHLCDRFFRVEKSRSKSTGGTGLGLAIAKEITHRHGGSISITSNPASGTQICIRLPQA